MIVTAGFEVVAFNHPNSTSKSGQDVENITMPVTGSNTNEWISEMDHGRG
jgi:hypothetical protein